MKKYMLYVFLCVCSFAVPYLGVAFIAVEMDFRQWSESARALVLFLWAVLSVVSIGMAVHGKQDNY